MRTWRSASAVSVDCTLTPVYAHAVSSCCRPGPVWDRGLTDVTRGGRNGFKRIRMGTIRSLVCSPRGAYRRVRTPHCKQNHTMRMRHTCIQQSNMDEGRHS